MADLSRQQILDFAAARQRDALELSELKRGDYQQQQSGNHGQRKRAPSASGLANMTMANRTQFDDLVEDSGAVPLARVLGDGNSRQFSLADAEGEEEEVDAESINIKEPEDKKPGAVSVAGPGATAMVMAMNSSAADVSLTVSMGETTSYNEDSACIGDEPVTPLPPLPPLELIIPPRASEMEHPRSASKARRFIVIAAGVVLAVAATLAIVIPLVVLVEGDQEAIEDGMLSEITASPTDGKMLVPGLSNATLHLIETDPFSPQGMAYDWLQRDPFLADYPDWKIQQRFVMVVYFHAVLRKSCTHCGIHWNSYHRDECEWIQREEENPCTEDGRIQILFNEYAGLSMMSLKGALPFELVLLTDLKRIDMSNSLQYMSLDELVPHPLPPSLQELHCNDCELQGTIPANFVVDRGLVNLRILSLDQNQLTGSIPTDIGSDRLERLALSRNNLDASIPSELGLLTNLQHLFLSGNRLTGSIPDEVWKLPLLIALDVMENVDLLESLPEEVCSSNEPLSFLRTDWCQDLPVECATTNVGDTRQACCGQLTITPPASSSTTECICDPRELLTHVPKGGFRDRNFWE